MTHPSQKPAMLPLAPSVLPAHARAIDIRTPSRSYRAIVGSGLLDHLHTLAAAALGVHQLPRAALLTDAALPAEFTQRAASALRAGGVIVALHAFTPSEQAKSLATVERMLEALSEHALERSHPVIALAGGIIGDMAGFAAASYRRGVPWINCPTTLLSMVDASVGGKTAVNVRAGGSLRKNMAGAFWQPSLVLADVDALVSLPERHFRSGLAECIKHSMLAAACNDAALFEWTQGNLPQVMRREPSALIELIARNIAVKARIVETDEREELSDASGGRALLNLGHTFAHAIETIPSLSPSNHDHDAPLQHGEAVALGIAAAAHLAVSLRVLSQSVRDAALAMLSAAGLPTRVRGLPPAPKVLTRMSHDKKVAAGKLRLIVPLDGHVCRVMTDVPEPLIHGAIDAMRAD